MAVQDELEYLKSLVAQLNDKIHSLEAKAKAAFGEAYPKLQQIKKKYDPELVFNRWYPIIPA